MSYRSVLSVSNGGPWNPKLTLKINSLRIKHKAQILPVGCLANTLSKSKEKKKWFFDHSTTLKGHSHLAHMRIRYHFIANLHITETRSILFLTKSDKNIIEWAKAHSKTGFSVNNWKSSKTLRRLKRNSTCTLISGWLFLKWENECLGQRGLKLIVSL